MDRVFYVCEVTGSPEDTMVLCADEEVGKQWCEEAMRMLAGAEGYVMYEAKREVAKSKQGYYVSADDIAKMSNRIKRFDWQDRVNYYGSLHDMPEKAKGEVSNA